MRCKRCETTVAGYSEPPETCPNCDINNQLAASLGELVDYSTSGQLRLTTEPTVTLTLEDLSKLTLRAMELALWQVPASTKAKLDTVHRNAWLDGYARAMTNIMAGIEEMMHE